MKALVKTAPGRGNVALRDVADPEPGRGEVLVAVRRAGLCGTDVSFYDWTDIVATGYRPVLPQVMGHEMAGEVAAWGPGVEGVRVGDSVVVSPHLTCGTCCYCRAGRSMLCRQRRVLGMDGNGAFADLLVAPARNVFRVPDGLSWSVAALAEPFTVAVHALERVPVAPGDVVAIVGAGSVGLCLLAAVGLTPHSQVLVVGLSSDVRQLELAAKHGARTVVADREDASEIVRDLTGGEGADVVFEAAGHPDAVSAAIALCRPGGRIALVGLPHHPTPVDTAALAFAEQELVGVRAYDLTTWRRATPLLPSVADLLGSLVTHELPLADLDGAIELTRSREAIKVLLIPGGDA